MRSIRGFLDLGVSGPLHELGIRRRIVGHQHVGILVEGINQQAGAFVEGGIGGSPDRRAAPRASPALHSLEQPLCHVAVPGFEEAEPRRPLAVGGVMQAVLDARDPADRLPVAHGEPQLECRVFVKRVACRIEAPVLVASQRRDPVGIVGVERVRKLDELPALPARRHGHHARRSISSHAVASLRHPRSAHCARYREARRPALRDLTRGATRRWYASRGWAHGLASTRG
jgi:hypothetical protein